MDKEKNFKGDEFIVIVISEVYGDDLFCDVYGNVLLRSSRGRWKSNIDRTTS